MYNTWKSLGNQAMACNIETQLEGMYPALPYYLVTIWNGGDAGYQTVS